MQSLFDQILYWGSYSLFQLGVTQVTPLRLVGLIVILVAAWWSSLLLERSLQRLGRQASGDVTHNSSLHALTRLLRYTVWIIGSITGLNWLGFDLANLALIGGAIGVGIGFGLQNIFSNFISGIIILLEKTLKLGDFVDLQSGVVGTVTEMGMRYTRVTTNDAVDVIVPNSEFINGRVTNWSLDNSVRRVHIPFGVAYGCDKDLVKQAGVAAALSVSGTVSIGKPGPDVWLVNFGASSLDFELVAWVDKSLMTTPGRTHALYMWALETELTRRGIEIPFPQRDLHVRSGRLSIAIEKSNQRAP